MLFFNNFDAIRTTGQAALQSLFADIALSECLQPLPELSTE